MFETSVVQARVQAASRATVLSVSLAAHAIAVVGALVLGFATVQFPESAPNQLALAPSFYPVTVPPPLGNPNGGAAAPKPAPKPAQPLPQAQPTEITAPSTVPDTIEPVASVATTSTDGAGSGTGTVPGPIGVPWGDPNSVATDLNLPPATSTPVVEEKIYRVGGDVKAPRVISRVEPRYPPALARVRKSAVVHLRCIIDKNGNVRDANITYSSFAAFNEPVLAAIHQWRFAPGSLNGNAVDTEFELRVNFSVN